MVVAESLSLAMLLVVLVCAVVRPFRLGPNLTYAGSLATLLWRRIVHHHEHDVDLREFTTLGLLTVPAALALATVALWVSLRLIGT
ncbi:ArsB/NhaD family transporter [Streptomyces libani]